MTDTVRFGVSVSLGLLDQFDRLIKRCGYQNRSEAVRDLIRSRLVEDQCEIPDGETFAVALLVYDHHKMSAGAQLAEIQHEARDAVTGAFQEYLDEHNCLQVVVMHGPGRDLRKLGERMISLKGVKYGKLIFGACADGTD